jgi:hypothetical protein
MKTSHIVGISIAAFLVVIIIGGIYLVGEMSEYFEETYTEAVEYAKDATKDECLEKYVADYKSCDGITCFSKTATFGVMCMMEAQGDVEEFCADKPRSESEVKEGDWNREFCKPRGLDDQDCTNIYSVVAVVCSPDE